MGPERNAPENLMEKIIVKQKKVGFNGAGAECSGNLQF